MRSKEDRQTETDRQRKGVERGEKKIDKKGKRTSRETKLKKKKKQKQKPRL